MKFIYFSGTTSYSRHMKSVKIGVSILVVFILAYIPVILSFSGWSPLGDYTNYFFCINYSANFFIYLVVDADFRVQLTALFCGCRAK